MNGIVRLLTKLGASVTGGIARLGFATRFFLAVLRLSGTTFARPQLLMREIYQAGVLSLASAIRRGRIDGHVGRTLAGA